MMPSTIQVPLLRTVSGGKPVPGDWNEWIGDSFREIRAIENGPPFAKYAAVPVDGQSLQAIGIFNRDFLIIRLTATYQSGKIGVWQTPHGTTAKFANMQKDGSVMLHNQNGWKEQWSEDDIKLIGIVVRVERDLS